jgi:hypothetical protein
MSPGGIGLVVRDHRLRRRSGSILSYGGIEPVVRQDRLTRRRERCCRARYRFPVRRYRSCGPTRAILIDGDIDPVGPLLRSLRAWIRIPRPTDPDPPGDKNDVPGGESDDHGGQTRSRRAAKSICPGHWFDDHERQERIRSTASRSVRATRAIHATRSPDSPRIEVDPSGGRSRSPPRLPSLPTRVRPLPGPSNPLSPS